MNHYNRIAESLTFLAEHYQQQPSLAELAARANLSEYHFQRVFTEWAGVSPKKFLQCLTLEAARQCLDNAGSVLDASLTAGLSGSSRLHDLFVTVEALSPGEYKSGGSGLEIAYGVHLTPFGQVILMLSPRGVTALSFLAGESVPVVLSRMQQRLPNASYHEDSEATAAVISRIFGTDHTTWAIGHPEKPADRSTTLPLLLAGTEFQVQVWRALLDIPEGACTSYSQLATVIGRNNAQRAVGNAVGRNPVAVVIPCHRVIRQTGLPGGYQWGAGRKMALLGIERLRAGDITSDIKLGPDRAVI